MNQKFMKFASAVKFDGMTHQAIFEIKLTNRLPVYMSVSRSPYENSRRFVVMVDTAKFLALRRGLCQLFGVQNVVLEKKAIFNLRVCLLVKKWL